MMYQISKLWPTVVAPHQQNDGKQSMGMPSQICQHCRDPRCRAPVYWLIMVIALYVPQAVATLSVRAALHLQHSAALT
jgi:hypothetical protein